MLPFLKAVSSAYGLTGAYVVTTATHVDRFVLCGHIHQI